MFPYKQSFTTFGKWLKYFGGRSWNFKRCCERLEAIAFTDTQKTLDVMERNKNGNTFEALLVQLMSVGVDDNLSSGRLPPIILHNL